MAIFTALAITQSDGATNRFQENQKTTERASFLREQIKCRTREFWGTAVEQWQQSGLQINKWSDQSYNTGVVHPKVHLISQGCP